MANTYAEIAHERILFAVNRSGLRQTEIIEKCNLYSWTNIEGKLVRVTKSDLSQYLSGKSVPGNWKADILGKALDVSPVWLMGFDVPMSRESINNHDVNRGRISPQREKLINLCMEASEEEVAMLYRLVAAARNVKV